MQRFLELVELAKSVGTLGGASDGQPRVFSLSKEQEAYLEASHPFVVTPVNKPSTETAVPLDTVLGKYLTRDDLDLPFPVISIELLGGGPMHVLLRDGQPYRTTLCVVLYELKPREQYAMRLCQEVNSGFRTVFVSGATPEIDPYVRSINTQRLGFEPANIKFRLGSGKTKRQCQIKQIIHVAPSNRIHEVVGSREIDWSHRFEVRGHWRRLEGLGKDREGRYCVNGWTWINNHIRGPDDRPLIAKKVRVVTDTQEPPSRDGLIT